LGIGTGRAGIGPGELGPGRTRQLAGLSRGYPLAPGPAAQALELDFIPLYQERYDLVIPHRYYYAELLEPLIHLLGDPEFKNTVAGLPGYNVDKMGQEVL